MTIVKWRMDALREALGSSERREFTLRGELVEESATSTFGLNPKALTRVVQQRSHGAIIRFLRVGRNSPFLELPKSGDGANPETTCGRASQSADVVTSRHVAGVRRPVGKPVAVKSDQTPAPSEPQVRIRSLSDR